jgi:wyosine [tRNA(Phe)-imidazoG37] synthetase (radical SAM superfamily)
MGNFKYLFGPVPSRRFGRSLGVDLNPYKTCSLDCVFYILSDFKKCPITHFRNAQSEAPHDTGIRNR